MLFACPIRTQLWLHALRVQLELAAALLTSSAAA